MLNKYLKKYIPSKYYRDYLEEIDAQFTDSQIASILYKVIDNQTEKEMALAMLASETEDTNLRNEIDEYFEVVTREIEELKLHDENTIYQIITETNDVDFPYGYTCDYDTAMKICLRNNQDFQIIKNKVIEEIDEHDELDIPNEEDDKYRSVLGMMSFDSNGVLQWYWTKNSKPKSAFTTRFIPIPYPFEKGDIVKSTMDSLNRTGVIEVSKEHYEAHKEEVRKDATLAETENEYVEVSWLSEDGKCYTGERYPEEVFPLYLEKLDESEGSVWAFMRDISSDQVS